MAESQQETGFPSAARIPAPLQPQWSMCSFAPMSCFLTNQGAIKRKGVFGRVAVRLLVALLIFGLGIGAYVYSTGAMDFSSLTGLVQRVIGSAQVERASLYERSA